MYINFEKKFELDHKDLNNPVVLIGWPGMALVSKLAISSIKDSLKAEELWDIEFFDFPPKANVEKGALEIPTAKLYFKSREPNDIFILTANYQPQSAEGVFEFSKKFCEEMDQISGGKIKMYVSNGALLTENVSQTHRVHVCGTDKDIVDSFLKFENTTLMDSGVIAGANGILPAWAGIRGYAPGICLLAETLPLPIMTLDPHASKALVTLITDYFNMEMNFEELDKKIEEMELIIDSFKKKSIFMKGSGQEEIGPDSYFR